jgi:hypothetical protein
MNKKNFGTISLLLAFSLVFAACGSKVEPTPTIDPKALGTMVAMTVQAEITKNAPTATATLAPTSTPQPIPTMTFPVSGSQPTASSSGSATTGTSPTLPASTADNAKFVSDVTVPDGTIYWKGETFTKSWKIQNTGTTTWDSSYNLIYIDGDQFSDEIIINLPQEVAPSEKITLNVHMKAPRSLGKFTSYYKMMNSKGVLFGDALSVNIVVGTYTDKTPTPSG